MAKAKSCCASSWAARLARLLPALPLKAWWLASIDGTVGALLEVNCETDFVTKNDSFLALANAAVSFGRKAKPRGCGALGALAHSQTALAQPWKRCAKV